MLILTRELSHGFFSYDNHEQLSGPKTGIPVFEAKLGSDTRLVYAIDCFSDGSGQVRMKSFLSKQFDMLALE